MSQELDVQLKARNSNDKKIYTIYPATRADNILENENKRFVSDDQISMWTAGIDTTSAIEEDAIDTILKKDSEEEWIEDEEEETLNTTDINDIFYSNR